MEVIARTEPRPLSCQWGVLLRDRDGRDPGRLTDERRQTVLEAFGPDKRMRFYGRGIRRRFASMPAGGPRRILAPAPPCL